MYSNIDMPCLNMHRCCLPADLESYSNACLFNTYLHHDGVEVDDEEDPGDENVHPLEEHQLRVPHDLHALDQGPGNPSIHPRPARPEVKRKHKQENGNSLSPDTFATFAAAESEVAETHMHTHTHTHTHTYIHRDYWQFS